MSTPALFGNDDYPSRTLGHWEGSLPNPELGNREQQIPQFAHWVIGHVSCPIAKWVNGTDLCSIGIGSSGTKMTHSADWVNGTVVCSMAKWVNGTDLCPTSHWGIGSKDCPTAYWVMRTDLDPNGKCVQGKGALQAHFLETRRKNDEPQGNSPVEYDGQTQERPGTGPGRRRESCGEWAIY